MNCWEYKKCGREDTCKAATFELADGFLGGKNGGRACIYITGSLCNSVRYGSPKANNCKSCGFYKILKEEHGRDMNVLAFSHFIEQRQGNVLPLHDMAS